MLSACSHADVACRGLQAAVVWGSLGSSVKALHRGGDSNSCSHELKRPARGLSSGLGRLSFTAATGAGVSSFGAAASLDPSCTAGQCITVSCCRSQVSRSCLSTPANLQAPVTPLNVQAGLSREDSDLHILNTCSGFCLLPYNCLMMAAQSL